MLVHMSAGGPTYRIAIRGKLIPFELHPYVGPHPLNKSTGDPLKSIPAGFFEQIELWEKGGKKLAGDICIVPECCSECSGSGDEIRHIGGRHFEIVGKCKSCKGDGFMFGKAEGAQP